MNTHVSMVTTQPDQVGRGTAVPLVKATLHGILPLGSEVPWVPIPLRSMGLDDSPCYTNDRCGIRPKTNPLFHREDVTP